MDCKKWWKRLTPDDVVPLCNVATTGELFAMVSMPNFNPNSFVDGIDPDLWNQLNQSPDVPLLNRALRGIYPPGSTYKPFMAVAALASGARTPEEAIQDQAISCSVITGP